MGGILWVEEAEPSELKESVEQMTVELGDIELHLTIQVDAEPVIPIHEWKTTTLNEFTFERDHIIRHGIKT
jgi:hypothetical protein